MKPIPLNVLAKMLKTRNRLQKLIHGVAIDSRNIRYGDLFFALPGEKVDGHSYLAEAASKGAAAAVVRRGSVKETGDLPLIFVDNVLDALQDLARQVQAQRSSKVIAITGSLGKTTTKEFAAALLKSSYKIFSSPRSYNSQATLPLSLLMADGDEDLLILEMGMSKPGEMEKLVSIAPPDIAVITTVAIQHTCNFTDGLEGIYREKGKILSHPRTRLGIIHRDIVEHQSFKKFGNCKKIHFSLHSKEADYYLEITGSGVKIFQRDQPPIAIEISLPVKPLYQNYLAAVIIARSCNVPWEKIAERSILLRLPPMRFERVEKKGVLFINDAYNANPDSMKAALEHLPPPKIGGKVIAVLGDMSDLGIYAESGHASVAVSALKSADLLFCIGDHCETMRKIWKEKNKDVELFDAKEKLLMRLKESAKPGDVVLLKGSRIHALEKILEGF